jgi:RNA polymerase sigma-70 factor (ECF subfamily)
MADASPTPPLEDFHSYLTLLARAQINRASCSQIDPMDAVQQTLVAAQKKFHQYRGTSNAELAGWLRAILANHLKDVLRRKGWELDEQALARQLEESSLRLDRFVNDEQSTPSQRALRVEQLTALADALITLPEDQRLAIELRHLHGHTLTEIAKQMQRSTASVGGLLQRGLKQLRGKLHT